MQRAAPGSSRTITPELVLQAYCVGLFPAADARGIIRWYDPDPRCIFELDGLRISRSLRRTIRRGVFQIRINTAFDRVIAACADRPEGTWISPQIRRLYCELHRRGLAHSVESWCDGELVGGLYGIAIGGAFFGESMFHRRSDASKVALVALVERLRQRRFVLLDSQWSTPHLLSLGAIEISRAEYRRRLAAAIALPRQFVEGASIWVGKGAPAGSQTRLSDVTPASDSSIS